ncbi:MAG: polysulfide reductase [Blastopirellula sp.]|nr:MAG: polysulfide reductase [Blastopirellula sp.]
MEEVPFIFPSDEHTAWSIMIVLYPYITGLVAGAFVVSALYHVFHKEELKPVARLALVTSFCFAAFATVPLLLHLHHPERCFQVMITPSTTSAIAGFGFIYNAYMLILVVEIWLVFRPTIAYRAKSHDGIVGMIYWCLALGCTNISERAKAVDDWMIKALSVIGIPVACVLHGYVGFLFGAVKANPWWSTALMPIIFLMSAIVSGIAALILLYLFISKRRGVAADPKCVASMARYLWLFLVMAVTLEGMEILHMAYEAGSEWEVLHELITVHLFTSYIVIQVLIGSLIPLLLLPVAFLPKIATKPKLLYTVSGIASVLILIQVFAMRWNVVMGGQMFSKSFRGFTEIDLHWYTRESPYVAAVVMVLPLIALWVASKLLPLWQESEA